MESFCTGHGLLSTVLDKALELRQQLLIQIVSVLGPLKCDVKEQKKEKREDDQLKLPRHLCISIKQYQLHRNVVQIQQDGDNVPPTAAQRVALSQLLLAAYCDKVAKRVPVGTIRSGTRRERLTAYHSCVRAL